MFEVTRGLGAHVQGDLPLRRLTWRLIDQAERFLPEMVANARLNRHSRD